MNFSLTKLKDHEYKLIRDLIYNRFGVNLTEQKRSLIVGRLNSLLKKNKFTSFQEYYDWVLADKSGGRITELIDKISTNHTFFYRESDHFNFFSQRVLPELLQYKDSINEKKLRIWIAGCSSGEESYMIAMLIHEFFKKKISLWDAKILSTDISTTALEKAVRGIYEADNVTKLPKLLLNSYFTRIDENSFKVKKNIQDIITFRKLNLIRESYPFKGKFDVIFCRNVMIYFDQPTRKALVQRYHNCMIDGGYLFIGHSETLGRMDTPFNYIQPAVYKKD